MCKNGGNGMLSQKLTMVRPVNLISVNCIAKQRRIKRNVWKEMIIRIVLWKDYADSTKRLEGWHKDLRPRREEGRGI